MPRSLGARAACEQPGAAAVRADVLPEELFHPLHALFVLDLGEGIFHRVDRVEVGEVQLRGVIGVLGLVEDVLFHCRAVVDDLLFRVGVSSRKGTLVRTPISRQTSVISDHISVFQGATAPSSMVRESSGTRVARSTVRTMPVPPQVRQAP